MELCFRIQAMGGAVYYCGLVVAEHLVPDSRVTRRFLRERAYWQGRTSGLFFSHTGQLSTLRRLGAEATIMAKDWAKAIAFYSLGRRRAFEHELAAWKRLGQVKQILFSASNAQPSVMTRAVGSCAASRWSR